MARRTPEQAPAPETSDLGAAIEALIQQRVDEALAKEREQHPPPRVRNLFNAPEPYTDFKQIPATQRPAAKPTEYETIWHRDGAGRVLWCETIDSNGKRFVTKVERDGAGAIIRARTTPPDESPVLPALDIDYKAGAREYKDGV